MTEMATPGTNQSMAATPEQATEIQLAFEGSDLEDDNESDSVIQEEPKDTGSEDPEVLIVPDDFVILAT